MRRSRHKSNEFETITSLLTYGYFRTNPWYWDFGPTYTYTVRNYGLRISDMDDVKSRGVYTYNDCDHVTKYCEYIGRELPGLTPGATFVYLDTNSTPTNGTIARRAYFRDACERSALNCSHEIGSYSVEEVKPLLENSDLPHKISIDRNPFDTDFSIWYTVVDLVDLRRTFQKLLQGSFVGEFRRNRKKFRHNRETAKKLADAHLGTRFGIIPTVRDLQDTVKTIKSWQSSYDQMDQLLSKRYRRRKYVDISDWEPFGKWEEDVTFSMPSGNAQLNMKIKSETRAEFRSLALYGFIAPEFQGWLNRLCQITDSFGVLDPSALWDIIPFSFIVDWFFTTNQYFHKLKPRLFPATAVIYDYLETIKVVTTVTYTMTWNAAYFGGPFSSIASSYEHDYVAHAGTETYTTYVRKRTIPHLADIELLPSARDPRGSRSFVTANRIAIAASLLAQRL